MVVSGQMASSCSKEQQKFYQEWFNVADSGFLFRSLLFFFFFFPHIHHYYFEMKLYVCYRKHPAISNLLLSIIFCVY